MEAELVSEAPPAVVEGVERSPARLSLWSLLLCLGISVAIFLRFNPIWEVVRIGDLDRGIWWSYGVLLPLAALFLAMERKLSAAPLFLETLKLILLKFVLTYALASVGWVTQGPPLSDASAPWGAPSLGSEQPYAPGPAPAPSVIDPSQLAGLAGRVLDAEGAPLAGALVYVASGLEGLRFELPGNEAQLSCGSDGFSPRFSVLRAYQVLQLRSADSQLHTVQVSDEGGHSLLNHPCTPGSERRLMFDHAQGMLRIGCRVHGSSEPSAHLLVTNNPFHTRSSAAGEFSLGAVPGGELELVLWTPGQGSARQAVQLQPGEDQLQLTLQLSP